jgi:hypothetical protein
LARISSTIGWSRSLTPGMAMAESLNLSLFVGA